MQPKFAAFTDALKSIYGLAGSIGVLVPAAATFLTTYAPPPRVMTSSLTAALATAALLGTFYTSSKPRSPEAKLPTRVRRALWVLGISVVLLVIYTRVLDRLTVATRDGELRFQIGFYKADFGLTAKGDSVRSEAPEATPYQWLLEDGLLESEGPGKLWEWWVLDLSALTLFSLFAFAFVLWSHGWSLLAVQRAEDAAPDEPDRLHGAESAHEPVQA